jgi:hypothetical protein
MIMIMKKNNNNTIRKDMNKSWNKKRLILRISIMKKIMKIKYTMKVIILNIIIKKMSKRMIILVKIVNIKFHRIQYMLIILKEN